MTIVYEEGIARVIGAASIEVSGSPESDAAASVKSAQYGGLAAVGDEGEGCSPIRRAVGPTPPAEIEPTAKRQVAL